MPELDLNRVIQGTLLGDGLLSATVAVLLADDTGHYVAVNDAACRLTGFGRLDLTSSRMGTLGADERSARIYASISRGLKLQGRKRVRCKDGEVTDCRYWAIRCTVASVPYYLLLLWPKVLAA